MSKDINNILIPNVSKIPKQKNIDNSNKIENSKNPNEFKNLLNEITSENPANGLNLSIHTQKKLKKRNLKINQTKFFKIKNTIEKLHTKKGQNSLVITGKAAYIIDINNNKIITTINKDNITENVFTKINSTIILN